MAHHDDITMPKNLRFQSTSGIRHDTQRVQKSSGFRKANAIWSRPLRVLENSYRLEEDDAQAIDAIFEVVRFVDSFNARDWRDWNSGPSQRLGGEDLVAATDQNLINKTTDLPEGNGSAVLFQLEKWYTAGATSRRRVIEKPEAPILVAVDGTPLVEDTDYTVDYATGEVDFTIGTPPGAGLATTWGGAFLIPVSFVDDEGLVAALIDGKLSDYASIRLQEERLT